MRRNKIYHILKLFMLIIFIIICGHKEDIYALTLTKEPTDMMYVLTTVHGNAVLLKSGTHYILVDAGDNGNGEDGKNGNRHYCDTFKEEIKYFLNGNKLEYIILSHTDQDHYTCIAEYKKTDQDGNEVIMPGILKDSNLVDSNTNMVMKYYYATQDITTTSNDQRDRYRKIVGAVSTNNVNLYAIHSQFGLTRTDGGRNLYENNNFSFFDKSNNNVTPPSSNMHITDVASDYNKSYVYIKAGNYKLYLYNLPQRFESTENDNGEIVYTSADNLNSVVVYGEIDGYKMYIAGDMQNMTYRSKSATSNNCNKTTAAAYADTETYAYSDDCARIFSTHPYHLNQNKGLPRLADFYAQYIHNTRSNGPLDIYVAGHHGVTNGTSTFIADQFIDKNTKIVFTSSSDVLSKYNYGVCRDDNKPTCAAHGSDSTAKHRCLNDKTVTRIIYSLAGHKPTSSSSATIYHTSASKVLRFGFNPTFDDGTKAMAVDATGTTYKYKSNIVK